MSMILKCGATERISADQMDKPLILGRDPSTDSSLASLIVLDQRTVSRNHARIERTADKLFVYDLGSTNGTYLDGKGIHEAIFTPGSKLQVGPYSIRYLADGSLFFTLSTGIRLDVHGATLVVSQGKTIVDHVSLSIEPNSFVAVVGGSGAGKSSLLSLLNGSRPPSNGQILINGEDLYEHYDHYRSRIGFVPQQDIVHGELTIEEVLYYTAGLRLAQGLNASELEHEINEVLNTVELSHVANNQVRTLSGGQRKRVCIAAELLSQPELIFLDEPTSGLDPGLDRKMMRLMKRLSDTGRTIVLVTHATASVSECDRLVFMGLGGKLCFYGSPSEVGAFFDQKSNSTCDFTDVYDSLADDVAVAQSAQRYQNSEYYRRYIGRSQAFVKTGMQLSKLPVTLVSSLKQYLILSRRYAKLLLRDRGNLLLLLLQAPLIGGVLDLVTSSDALKGNPMESEIPLFILVTAALWLGLLNSIREIVKEKVIFRRERMVNLSTTAYLLSKITILSVFAIIQALSLTLVVAPQLFASLSDPVGMSVLTFGTLFLTIISCSALGLFISALVPNPAWAVSVAPLILVPQLVLSGVLFSQSAASTLGFAVQSKWSMDSLGNVFALNALYEKFSQEQNQIQRKSEQIPTVNVIPGLDPLKLAADLGRLQAMQKRLVRYPKAGYDRPFLWSWAALAGFSILFLGLAYFALARN